MPHILRDLQLICCEECTGADVRKFELQAIQQLSVMMKQLICTTEWMTRYVRLCLECKSLLKGLGIILLFG